MNKLSLPPKSLRVSTVLLASTLLVALSLVTFGSLTKRVNAAPVTGFSAGRIIDDSVFVNTTTMGVSNIQAFLNSKVPTCDTQGTQPSEFGGGTRAQYGTANGFPPPYICLKDYTENGLTSAQILYNTAQKYQINPQVLIVLLQKEQGLVTDEWPAPGQYKTATGYGCPDTAPCASQYFGLTNQLDWSGKMFRAIMNNSPSWYTPYVLGNNTIQFSPNASCGSSTVNIENRSTQALYNYTPYQPNQAALDAGWGQAPCGAYGNRNFYLYFTSWFGGTQYQAGRISSSSTIYAKSSCTIPLYDPSVVGRLYNPDTQDYLYTIKRDEACSAVKLGYIWDGIVMKNEGDQTGVTAPVYRLRRGSSHVYTANSNNYTNMVQGGYIDEGISFYAYAKSATGRLPVYMMGYYDNKFFTSAGGEGTYFINSLGYKSFGIGFYVTSLASNSALYRLSSGADKLYTTSSYELSSALSSYGYHKESTTLSVDTAPGQYSLPVYRLNSQYGRLYTTDRKERDIAIINYGYNSEGIGFYSYPDNLAGVLPVYRSTNYTAKSRLYTQYQGESLNSQTYYGYIEEGVAWYGL